MVKLALVTKLGRESGSMIRATATLGAALMAATMAVQEISIRSHKIDIPRVLTVNVLRLVLGQLSSLELSVGSLGSTITSRKIVHNETEDVRAGRLCKHGGYQWNSGNRVAVHKSILHYSSIC